MLAPEYGGRRTSGVQPTFPEIIKECFRQPRQNSYWDPVKRGFVCPNEIGKNTELDNDGRLILEGRKLTLVARDNFKIVFISSVLLTVFFAAICYGLTIYYKGTPP